MLGIDRKQKIIAYLEEHEVASIHDLSELTGASESTLRRDLSDLEKQYEITRVHGGASLARPRREEPTLAEKIDRSLPEKKAVAQAAASQVKEGETIFLDAGSTTLEMIPFLAGNSVTVVTNGVTHVSQLIQAGIPTYVTGGQAKATTAALVGTKAVDTLSGYYFDRCFIGANSVDMTAGYTTPDPEECAVKQTALTQAAKAYVIADASKIGTVSFAKIAPLAAADFITTNDLDHETFNELIKQTNVKVAEG
ncbi:DeoR family transcriptional regulator [Salsuginibacillus halophilus]|uniref:DeoR family transcriptional regulator n=1 Tax=Salsuginibacillus halophilus TaxID=517424 RepID=A0A2P8HQZ9_9BACI|nr:DeoR/GlpR family DNA-binding transcription regulator [Salsuginibacillus halophilus]PSL48614.1 DeoR family transcriptional regulator [Salsuginibacillus halophilus]